MAAALTLIELRSADWRQRPKSAFLLVEGLCGVFIDLRCLSIEQEKGVMDVFLTVEDLLSDVFYNCRMVSALSHETLFESLLAEDIHEFLFSKGELPIFCTVPSSRHSKGSGKEVRKSVAVFASGSFTGVQIQSDSMSSPPMRAMML